MNEKLDIESVGITVEQIKKSFTKKDVDKIISTYKKMAFNIQELFINQYGFKKVDNEYLELKIDNSLIELRIVEMVDCVYLSLGVWENNNHMSIYMGDKIETVYFVVKLLIEKLGGKNES